MSNRLTVAQALELYRNAPLATLGAMASDAKEQVSGRYVYYNRNIHIEPTNICVFRCEFCSYRRAENDPSAWYYNLEEIENIALGYQQKPITEVHIVGGVHPSHDLKYYCDVISVVKRTLPKVAIKAYTAVELHYIIKKAGLPLAEGLKMLKDAGMDAIPGGGAEIFDPAVRSKICPDKSSAQEWLDTHREAHKLGIRTNATVLYGHIETPEQLIDHLNQLRSLQDQTNGFDAFIPLKFRAANNQLGASISEVPITTDMRVMAISRLMLDNIPHIKAYWPMFGKQTTQMALSFGADDIDGTIDDTTKIYSMAGASDENPAMTTLEMKNLISAAGYTPVQRDTFYNIIND